MQTRGPVLELHIGFHAGVVTQLQGARQLRHGNGGFLRLRAGNRQLVQVDGRHALGDAVHAEEQRGAPDQRMLAQAVGQGGVAQLVPAEDEPVEHFRIAPADAPRVGGKCVVGRRDVVAGRLGRVRGAAVVDRVIPRGGAQAQAEAILLHVEFGQQVGAVRDQALAEIAVAIVVVHLGGAADQGRRRRVDAVAGAVLDGVVPADLPLAAGIEVGRAGRGADGHQHGGEDCERVARCCGRAASCVLFHRVSLIVLIVLGTAPASAASVGRWPGTAGIE